MQRDGFVFYESFYKAILKLSDEDKLRVFTQIAEYGLYGNTIDDDTVAGAIFEVIKPQIDANNKRFENGKKGAEYGALGGRPKRGNTAQNPDGDIEITPQNQQENPNGVLGETPKEKEKEKEKDIYNPIVLEAEDCLGKLCKNYRTGRANKTESRNSFLTFLEGTKKCKGSNKRIRLNHVQILLAAKQYITECDDKALENKHVLLLSTFLNGRLLDYIEKTQQAYEEAMRQKYGETWQEVQFAYV